MNWRDIFTIPKPHADAHVRRPLSEEHLQQYLGVVSSLAFGFDAVSDHVVITDPDANIIYANRAVERNTGFPHDEIIGRNPADFWGGQMPQEFYTGMWQTIKIEKRPFIGEVRNKRKDGTEYWQELHISPVLWDNGDVKFFIGIEPNITERKEKEKFREEFTSVFAHQLKNPMASFKWTLDLLLREGMLTENQQEMIAALYKGNESLINLVNDLLVFSRIENISQLKKEKFDAVEEVERIIQNVKTTHPHVLFIAQKDSTFSFTSHKPLILQMFTNIIVNAAEYSDATVGKVEVGLLREGDTYVFSCKDNGIGIPEAEQAKIFSKFFRASNARKTKENGTGLGLFIVQFIADSLGWKVSFHSKFGEGTTFSVEIPRHTVEE